MKIKTTLEVDGLATFSTIPVGPASNPTTDNQLARKAYVDSLVTSTSSLDPGHKHSRLWASDGSPEAITVATDGQVYIGALHIGSTHLVYDSATGVIDYGPGGVFDIRELSTQGDTTNFTNRLRIYDSGCVAIGSTPSDTGANNLYVQGQMYCDSIFTCTNIGYINGVWPHLDVNCTGTTIYDAASIYLTHSELDPSVMNHIHIQHVKTSGGADTGNSDFRMSKGFQHESNYIEYIRIYGDSHNICWNNQKNTSQSFGNFIIVQGNLGIGTYSPTAQLHPTGTVRLDYYGAGTVMTDASGNISISSDERLKTIVSKYTYFGIDALKGIEPIVYKWNELSGMETETSYIGFSAQNVEKNVPGITFEDKRGYLSFSDRSIIAVLVNAIKQQQVQIEELQSRLNL